MSTNSIVNRGHLRTQKFPFNSKRVFLEFLVSLALYPRFIDSASTSTSNDCNLHPMGHLKGLVRYKPYIESHLQVIATMAYMGRTHGLSVMTLMPREQFFCIL